MKARVLVVRSGTRPVFAGQTPARLDVVERASHAIVPRLRGEGALEQPVDFAIFTSRVAVEHLLGDARLTASFRAALADGSVAAVGAATAEALARYGVSARIIGGGSAESLLGRLPDNLSGNRVLLPTGEDATPLLERALRSRGAEVARLTLYRKVPRPRDGDLAAEIRTHPFQAFCVTAPSAARWLFDELGPAARDQLRKTPAVALGPSTERFLRGESVARVFIPDPVSFAAAARLLESLAVKGLPA